MFGLFVWVIIGVVWYVGLLKNARSDGQSIRNSKLNNDPYYTDWKGDVRRVDNNHKVLRYTTSSKCNYDRVDIDLKTGEVLRNYSQEEREKIAAKEHKYYLDAQKDKEKAMEQGIPWYSSYESTENAKNMHSAHPYEYVHRRISDNLLVEANMEVMRDTKYNFILWRNEVCYKRYPEIYSLEKDKEWNLKRIDYLVKYKNINKQELEEYAKKIKAL